VSYYCCKNAPLLTGVALISNEEQNKARKSSAEEHVPLKDLEDNIRGLPCEAEIALANVNKRKEAKKKRKDQKCSSNVPLTRDKDNVEPPLKAKKNLNPRQDRQKAGAKASWSVGEKCRRNAIIYKHPAIDQASACVIHMRVSVRKCK
jgi:hypothetical protein